MVTMLDAPEWVAPAGEFAMAPTASTTLMAPPLLLQDPSSVSVPPCCALTVPWLVQLAPFRVMVPEARPSPRAVGSAVIVPRLWKAMDGTWVPMPPVAPVRVRLAPRVSTEVWPDNALTKD